MQSITDLIIDPLKTRNICVLAHVDHGKTTLSDFLIASNGIISNKLAGKVRYMDSREDEQERMITMKSSSIALHYAHNSTEYRVNLIDSPGHVDFSSEVSSAVRLVDGCLVVVDVVEGICTQTHTVLMQAYQENLTPCLVLNKMDRLFSELQMDGMQVYRHVLRILEQVNAIQSTLHRSTWLASQDESEDAAHAAVADAASCGGASGTEPPEDVLADIQEKTFEDAKQDAIDSESFFSPSKGNVVFSSAFEGWGFRIADFAKIYAEKLKVNQEVLQQVLFGEFYLNTKTMKITKKPVREGQEPMFVQFVLKNIASVYSAILPLEDDPEREKLKKIVTTLKLIIPPREVMNKFLPSVRESVFSRWLPLAEAVLSMVVQCLPSPVEAQRANISKLIPELFDSNAQLTAQQESLKAALLECRDSREAPTYAFISKLLETEVLQGVSRPRDTAQDPYVGFARLYCGRLSVGDRISIKSQQSTADFEVTRLFALMGRSLEPVTNVSAGQLFGIDGVLDRIHKTATLCSLPVDEVIPMKLLSSSAGAPIVRVAVESTNISQLQELIQGLRLLDRCDNSVEVYLAESGECVLAAAGEVHLERCLKDLKDKFASAVPFIVSPPLVPFRESLAAPTVSYAAASSPPISDGLPNPYSVRALPLPEEIASFLDKNFLNLKNSPEEAHARLVKMFESAPKPYPQWAHRIWSLGPRRTGPNILIDARKSFSSVERCWWRDDDESGFVAGFQVATRSGPMCEEPLWGVCFVLEELELDASSPGSQSSGTDYSSIMSNMRDACHRAYLKAPAHRLKEPAYLCQLFCSDAVLGKAHGVLAKRRGKVLDEDVQEGTNIFIIRSLLPVVESFGFGEDLRKKTSGAAAPQLRFEGWISIDQDPLVAEELDAEGEKVDGVHLARKLMEDVRRRKGLFVEEKIVEKAEKQRTLTKNK
nr:ribosome assembly protein 1 [Andalucia godoyi]|eukprot:ANDGO_03968.mRNA.1 Ribosome assembly protein 1